jgi:hypothetical protein
MQPFLPQLARVLARYLSGALMTAGFLAPGLGAELARDPEVLGLIGLALGGATETAWALAVRKGWAAK